VTSPAFLQNAEEEDAADLAKLTGVDLNTPLSDGQLDAFASDICRHLANTKADLSRATTRLKLRSMPGSLTFYESREAPIDLRIEQLEAIGGGDRQASDVSREVEVAQGCVRLLRIAQGRRESYRRRRGQGDQLPPREQAKRRRARQQIQDRARRREGGGERSHDCDRRSAGRLRTRRRVGEVLHQTGRMMCRNVKTASRTSPARSRCSCRSGRGSNSPRSFSGRPTHSHSIIRPLMAHTALNALNSPPLSTSSRTRS
jgi:hypothetical protein